MAEYCSDNFKIIEDAEDSFRMWQGLVGPHYTPYISSDGTLTFGNNGGLPNPSPVNLRGPQGAGIRIAGIVSTEESLPETAAGGDVWLVGDEAPYEGFSFIDGQWIDLGPLNVGPAGPPGPQGNDYILQESDKQEIAEIAEQVLLTELDETPLAVRYGGTGARTVSGAKENLGIDEIETKLGTWPLGTDAQDVAGAVNEMIGEISLQVDDIQKLKDDLAAEFNPNLTYAEGVYCIYGGNLYRCTAAVTTPGSWTGDTNWTEVKVSGEIKNLREDLEDINAGEVAYSSSATYAAGTVGAELVDQSTAIDDLEDIAGDGVLDSDFSATDLTGAANELKTSLTTLSEEVTDIKIAKYKVVASLSALQTLLLSEISSMALYETKRLVISLSSNFEPFAGGAWLFELVKEDPNYWSAFATSYGGYAVLVQYLNGSWGYRSTGTVYIGTNAVSLVVPSGSYRNICSVQVPAGTYVITGGFEWATTFTQITIGRMMAGESNILGTVVRSTGVAGGGYNAAGILSVSTATTINLQAYQGSGADVSASYISLKAVRIA